MKTLLICLLALITLSSSEELTGKVVRVSDGDTVVILSEENEQIRIRLDGIDCPESKQDFGQKAKEFTASLCAGKEVKILSKGRDRYGRVLGYVIVDGINVNKELLRAGFAWHYKQFNKDPELAALEATAKKEKKGLWSHPDPIAPWEFRKMKKK